MGIYVTVFLPLLVLTELSLLPSTKGQTYDITEGTLETRFSKLKLRTSRTFPPFELCKLGEEPNQVRLLAKVIKLGFRGKELFIRIEAMRPMAKLRKVFQKYEVEKSNMKRQELSDSEKNYREVIKEKGICASFKMESMIIDNTKYHVIKFHFQKEWWCGVYTTEDYKYKETGVCTEVFESFDLMKTMFSVSIPEESDFSKIWTPCHNEKPVDICEKGPNFEIKASPMCSSSQVKYNIITYYNGYSIATYKITYPQVIKKEDLKKFCKLFKMQVMETAHEQVGVQYFDSGNWKCEYFNRDFRNGNPVYLNSLFTIWQSCSKFVDKTKIRPVHKGFFRRKGKNKPKSGGILG